MIGRFHERTYLFNVKGINIFGNADNGAIIGLDKTGLDFVSRIMNSGLSESVISDAEEPILDALNKFGYFERDTKRIKNAYLHVTDRCTLHCVGCYSYVENRNERNELTTDEIFDIITQLSASGVEGIVISGGEPFLRDDIKMILERMKQCNIMTSVITNGTSDYKKVLEALPFIDILNVSVDGYSRNTRFIRDSGIMETVINFIEFFKEKVHMNLIFTLHKKNVEYMKDYIRFAESLKVAFNFSIFTVDPHNESYRGFVLDNNDIDNIANVINEEDNIYIEDSIINGNSDGIEGLRCQVGCGVGCSIISIAANGDIYPCHMLHMPELVMGNIKDTPLNIILKSMGGDWESLTVDMIEDCQGCEFKYMCGGGCRGRSYLYNKNAYKKDPFCKMTKKYLDQRTKVFESFPHN